MSAPLLGKASYTVQRLLGELGENAKFERGKKDLGCHEPESDLLNPIRASLCAHRSNLHIKGLRHDTLCSAIALDDV
jgi:hypothetical protein